MIDRSFDLVSEDDQLALFRVAGGYGMPLHGGTLELDLAYLAGSTTAPLHQAADASLSMRGVELGASWRWPLLSRLEPFGKVAIGYDWSTLAIGASGAGETLRQEVGGASITGACGVVISLIRSGTGARSRRWLDLDLGVGYTLRPTPDFDALSPEASEDPEAIHAVVHSLNQWLYETWQFNYKDRIFTTPVISLPIVDKAIAELEWVVERGAKAILIRPAPVPGFRHSRSFAYEEFDPFWKRAVELGVVVTMHASDSGDARYQSDWTGPSEMLPFKDDAFRWATATKRPIEDSMASAVCHGLFARHPKLTISVIENGGSWVPHLLQNLKETYKKMPQAFAEDPVKTFRQRVYVSPFFEDHMAELVEAMGGTDNIIFGSDYPHPEGLAEPCTYVDHLPKSFSKEDVKKVMGGNLGKLMGYEGMVQ